MGNQQGKGKKKKSKKDKKKIGKVIPGQPLPQRPPKADVKEFYDISKELGRGGMSVVYEGVDKAEKTHWAVKFIDMQAIDSMAVLEREIDIMSKLHHKNILQLREVFKTDDQIYLVTELVTGGELFDQIVAVGSYSESDAANIIRQVVDGVEYLHEQGVAHRDLKPENLLVGGDNDDEIKVADFGLSKVFGAEMESKLKTSCGTPDYVAPEVLLGQPYEESVDMWSVGVIAYILLCGFPPFFGERENDLFDAILNVKYDFPSPEWDSISKDAKDFVKALLVKDPAERLTAKQANAHPWLAKRDGKVGQGKKGELRSIASTGKLAEYTDKRKKSRKKGQKK